jgi:uncharacterized membrane protein YhdT
MCERFNRTLLGMLGTMEQDQKANWKAYVARMVHAYNCTRHESNVWETPETSHRLGLRHWLELTDLQLPVLTSVVSFTVLELVLVFLVKFPVL